jgi:hypothetical protein
VLWSAMETGIRSACEDKVTYPGFMKGRGVVCLIWVRSATKMFLILAAQPAVRVSIVLQRL